VLEHEQGDVHAVVRAKLIAGTLPRDTPLKVWGGPAKGNKTCSACDLKIDAPVIEYETETLSGELLFFHQPCMAVWNLERATLAI
jgi:hypothetical protein